MSTEPTVLVRQQGRIGRLTLNRPRALNALDRPMIAVIHDALEAWQADPSVHAVVIDAAGGRAFCAGGDVRELRRLAMAGDYAGAEAFFAAEYALNLQIARYPKPYVALIDGLCMGGGLGLSVHAPYRVATEAAQFAMPETAVGLFPDIGATFFLPRLRGAYGMYLALTGAHAGGADATWLGLATHFVPRAALPGLVEAMAADGIAPLAAATVQPAPGPLAAVDVDLFAGAPTVAAILTALEAAGTEWAQAALVSIRAGSPSSVLWTFELVRRGAARTLEQCLAAELAMTRHAMRHPDFTEGVRAMVVDKDRTPRWSPARIEDVDAAEIKAMVG